MATPNRAPSDPWTHFRRFFSPLPILISAFVLLAGTAGSAATLTVNSTGDDGDNSPGDGFCFTGLFTEVAPDFFVAACTLRAALEESNALAGADIVEFASTLPKVAGVVEIRPTTGLPWIQDAVTIDGYSADGYDLGDPGESPIINLSGSLIPAPSAGLTIGNGGSDTRIQGLAITNFGGDGITILAWLPAVRNVTIEGCEIGIWRGVFYQGNDGHGIQVRGSYDVTIGRTCTAKGCSGQRNVIAQSGLSGIRMISSTGVSVAGNLIGTDKSGTSTFVSFGGSTPNSEWGVEVINGSTNRIGEAQPGGENLISGNINGGIYIDATLTQIVNNKIGTNLAGTAALPNTGPGIELTQGPNTIGSLGAGRNLISGNDGNGVTTAGPNEIVGNVIGLSANESSPIGNTGSGIQLEETGASVRSNILSGNGIHGLLGFGADHEILSNRIGTNSVNEDMSNGLHGLILSNADNITVGRPNEGNIIAFNQFGIGVTGVPLSAHPTFIQGNFIGTNPGGENLGNTSSGVYISNVEGVVLGHPGGLESGRGNVIGFNGGYGVQIPNGADTANGNRIHGNYIGTNASDDSMGNTSGGVRIATSNHAVGAPLDIDSDTVASYGNRIAHNTGTAVTAETDALNSVIRGNEIYGNGGVAAQVDLGGDGPTPNDVGDIDAGDNHLQNFPEFITAQTEVNELTGDLEVRYRVFSNEGDSIYPLTVDFYLITEPGGMTDVYVGSDTYPASSATLFRSVGITPPPGLEVTGMLLATATDAEGNTSEISRQSVPVPEANFATMLILGSIVLGGRARAKTVRIGAGGRRSVGEPPPNRGSMLSAGSQEVHSCFASRQK